MQRLALRRAQEDSAELEMLAGAKTPSPVGIDAAARRAWHSVYESLVLNDGYRFDEVYAEAAVRRDGIERALAARELRYGKSAALKAIARRVLRIRAAETAAFGRP